MITVIVRGERPEDIGRTIAKLNALLNFEAIGADVQVGLSVNTKTLEVEESKVQRELGDQGVKDAIGEIEEPKPAAADGSDLFGASPPKITQTKKTTAKKTTAKKTTAKKTKALTRDEVQAKLMEVMKTGETKLKGIQIVEKIYKKNGVKETLPVEDSNGLYAKLFTDAESEIAKAS